MTNLGDVEELREIKTGPFGTQLQASEYSNVGAPVISVGEIGDGLIRVTPNTPRVDADVTTRLSHYMLDARDVVFARKGSVDRSAWVAPQYGDLFLGSDGVAVRFKTPLNARFFGYQFQTPAVRSWILRHASGSTMLSLNGKTLSRLPVREASDQKKRSVVEVLGALDDKIAANRVLVAGCDELRQVLWASLTSGRGCQEQLSSLARFVNGKAFTKDATGTGRVVIRIAELNSGVGISTVRNELEVGEDYLARPGDFLMAWSGSLTTRRWFRDEGIVNQHIFKVVPTDGRPLWAVASAVEAQMEYFKSIAADKATTMGHIQRRHLDEAVPWPGVIDEKVSAVGASCWSRALAAERESEQLARTRDELLPLLIDGRVTVKDAEKAVEGLI